MDTIQCPACPPFSPGCCAPGSPGTAALATVSLATWKMSSASGLKSTSSGQGLRVGLSLVSKLMNHWNVKQIVQQRFIVFAELIVRRFVN